MFAKLFSEAGLSLDRLRALVEVGAAGSIVKAAQGDPTRQSQYSRQIKEIEDFFQTKLVERHGKGVRLTSGGRELARISRFFLLGLSNFQRGCLAEEQTYRIGAAATFADQFLLPVLAKSSARPGPRYTVEIASNAEIERRLHDLTLDFGVVTSGSISRPLRLRDLGGWRLRLCVPRSVCSTEGQVWLAIREERLPLVWPSEEESLLASACFKNLEPRLRCASFLEARSVLEQGRMAALLPDFLLTGGAPGACLRLRWPALGGGDFHYRLAWNPRLLRLNPHATRQRDLLIESLGARMRQTI